MKSASKTQLLPWISLACLGLLMALVKSGDVTLRGIDSNIHAAVSMSVTALGLKPRLPIPFAQWPGGQFNDHPFTLFWLNGWVMRALGPSAFSARLLTGLFAAGSVVLTGLIGAAWRGPVYGLLAGALFATTRDWVFTGGTMSLDPPLVFFILLSFWCWVTGRRAWGAGLAAGFGLWVKTPVVLLLYPVAGLVAWAQGRLHKDLPGLARSLAQALALGLIFWLLTAALGGWDVVRDYWARQVWGTSVSGRGAPDRQWFFFFTTLRTGTLPWLPLLLWSLVDIARRGKRELRRDEVLYPLAAVGCVAVFVTFLQFKLGHYFTPVFPFTALLAALPLAGWLEKREARFYPAFTGAVLVLATVLVSTPISVAPEAFLALRKFETFIVRGGSCSDQIWAVPGGEPVGSVQDEALHLAFYTGRKVEAVACSELEARLKASAPRWLILSDENLRCLTPAGRARFAGGVLVGNQYLFGRDLKSTPVLDLTPLHTEGLAARDCREPEYPRDVWHRYGR